MTSKDQSKEGETPSELFKHQPITTPLTRDLSNSILSQLLILVTNIDNPDLVESHRKINSILISHPHIYPVFLRKLFNQLEFDTNEQVLLDSNNKKVLSHQINYLTLIDPDSLNYLVSALFNPTPVFDHFSLSQFLNFFNLSHYQALLICLSIEKFINSNGFQEKYFQVLKELPQIYINSSPGLINWFDLLKDKNQDSLALFLSLFFDSKVFSNPHKFIISSHILKVFVDEDPDNYYKVNNIIQRFLKSMEQINFKDLLSEFCKSNNLPELILDTLLNIQNETQLENGILILLREILFPKSQNLLPNNEISPLTPTSIVESTAKGLKFSKVIGKFSGKLDWEKLFKALIDGYDNTLYPITAPSLSQFFSAISNEDGLIDSFLLQAINSNDFNLITDVTIIISKFNPNEGAIDLFKSKLKPVVEADEENSLNKDSLLYFKTISMIEIKSVSMIALLNKNVVEINQLFERDINSNIELVLLGSINLLKLENENVKVKAILLNLIQKFLFKSLDTNSGNLNIILNSFDDKNSAELGKYLLKYYEVNNDTINLFGGLISNNDDVIMSMLHNAKDFNEAFKISIKFSQFGWKNFKNFINAQLKRNLNMASTTIVSFLEHQAAFEYENSQNGKVLNNSLNLEIIHFLLNSIQVEKLSGDLKARYNDLLGLCLQAYPRLINFGQGFDEAILINSSINSFSVDVEKEMKLYFQKMYKKEIEIKDIVHMLKKLKFSDNPHDQDVFACMIHSLLDEYRFYSEYPVDALATTSVLFGNTIVYKLVDGPALSIALRYILESAQQNPNSRMFKFAIQALYSFQRRLPEFRDFCAKLIEIPALKSQPDLFETCKNVLNGSLPVEYHQDDDDIVSNIYAIKAQPLKLAIMQEIPNSELSDKILFIINNLGENNLVSMVTELKNKLEPRYFQWFSNYLITQRVKSELNNQHLYRAIVSGIESSLFHTVILNASVKQVIQLTNKVFDNVALSPAEKTQLKNLGSWIGMITLGMDKPLVRSEINIKILLLDAFGSGNLEMILPFVCKLLEQAKSGSMFTETLPWMKLNLQFLREIYNIEELKLKLKFEIEFLFNSLKVKLNEIEPTTNLVNFNYESFKSEKLTKFNKILTFSKSLIEESAKLQPLMTTLQLQQQQSQLQQQGQPASGGESMLQLQQQQLLQQQRMLGQSPAAVNNVPSLAGQSIANSNPAGQWFDNLLGSTVFTTHQALKRFLHLALTKSVKEILAPLVNRTISVCLVTTKALILKDFAFESDEFKLRKAYINTVRTLTEYMITSGTEVLRENITVNLHMILNQALNGQIDQSIMEELPRAVNDNLPLAINIIQRAAIERAIHDMDDQMVASIALRRQFKSNSTGGEQQIFCDTQNANKFSISLPDPLGLQVGGVTPRQFNIYEEIGKSKAHQQQRLPMPMGGLPQQAQQQVPMPMNVPLGANNGQEQIVIFINQQLEILIKLLTSAEAKTASLNDNTEISRVVKGVLIEIFQGFSRIGDNNVFMKYAQMSMNSLFGNIESGPILTESFVLILSKICDFSTFVAKNINSWLFNSNDERRFNSRVIKAIIIEGIISLEDLTFYLEKFISVKRDVKAIEFSCELINELALKNLISLRSDFVNVIKAIEDSDEDVKSLPSVRQLMGELKRSKFDSLPGFGLGENGKLGDYLTYVFSEWVKLYNKSDDLSVKIAFLNQFVNSGILETSETMMNFFMSAFEVATAGFVRDVDMSKRNDIDKYTPMDALASMVIHLVLIQEDEDDNELRVEFLNRVLTVFLLVFSNDHEVSKSNFNERPFFRFFSILLSEWSNIRKDGFRGFAMDEADMTQLQRLNNQFYLSVSDMLLVIQPSAFPGFTFAWICLVSHRMYLPEMISNGDQNMAAKVTTILNCLLRFQSGYLQEGEEEMPEFINVIHKGTLKILLSILHDYPTYLAEWGLGLLVGVNLKFVQVRNIVLSGRPVYVERLDPFKATLEEEVFMDPISRANMEEFENWLSAKLKKLLDNYLRIPSVSLIRQIVEQFERHEESISHGVNYLFMNMDAAYNAKSGEAQLLRGILEETESCETKYKFLQAVVDQLRYESLQTKWAVEFLDSLRSDTQWGEMVMRVVMERLVCSKPIPFGVNAFSVRVKDEILALSRG